MRRSAGLSSWNSVAYDLQPFQEVHPVQISTRVRNPIAAELWSATTSKSCRGLYNRGSSTDQMRRWGDGHESVWTLRTPIISYPQNYQTLKHREHDAHDDPSGILINVRGPTSWNNCSQQYHLAVTSPHYLDVAISRGGGQQLITSGGHGHVPAVTKTGLLSANFLSARMAKWTLNGLLLCSALTMQWLDKCVYVYIHTYIYRYIYIYIYIHTYYIWRLVEMSFPKTLQNSCFGEGPLHSTHITPWSAISYLVGTRK